MAVKALEQMPGSADITPRGNEELMAFFIKQGKLHWSICRQTNGRRVAMQNSV